MGTEMLRDALRCGMAGTYIEEVEDEAKHAMDFLERF
jgi:hypothetical protein